MTTAQMLILTSSLLQIIIPQEGFAANSHVVGLTLVQEGTGLELSAQWLAWTWHLVSFISKGMCGGKKKQMT